MKNKIYVIVTVPLLERDFDMYIPSVKKVGTIKNLILKIIEEESDGAYTNDGCKNLYYKVTGEKIDENTFIRYTKIKNGTKLILY